MKVLAWYTDGRIYRATTARGWSRLPKYGALYFVLFDEGGRQCASGGDWYWYSDGCVRMVPSGDWGTWQPKPDVTDAKRGDAVSDAEYNRIADIAMAATWR